jgi:hypothetical protein
MAEPGVGKSRLMYEFKAIIPDECKVLEAYSVSHGKASAWLPVIELLKSYFEIRQPRRAFLAQGGAPIGEGSCRKALA